MEDSSKKTRFLHLVIGLFLLLFVWVVFLLVENEIEKRNDFRNLTDDDFSFVYQIDSVKEDRNGFAIEGWAFSLNSDSSEGNMEILLYDILENKIVYPKTEYLLRDDVNKYFLCEFDYSKSGIIAHFNSKKTNIITKDYEILIKDKRKRRIYRTDSYISQGKIMHTEPWDFKPLKVEETELQEIVENGELRIYRQDVGIYVYQYLKKLYWITENYYDYRENGNTYIECMADTTQYNKLPKKRRENNWKDDNLGFYFERNEIHNIELGDYRLVITELPSEYSISCLTIGCQAEGKEWIWKTKIRPWYEFVND